MDSATLPPAQFKDRKVGLVIFGAATALMGCCCALLVPLMIFATKMAARSANPPPAAPNILPVAVLYGALAVVLIWLGIGSIMTRRWARALLVIWSWSWLIAGLGAIAVTAVMAPHLAVAIQAAQPGRSELSSGARSAIILVPMMIFGFMFVLLPLIWGSSTAGRTLRRRAKRAIRWCDGPIVVRSQSWR